MAAREWIFYVYDIIKDGLVVYVGKGSGYRLNSQKKRFSADGYKAALFFNEQDAYDYEIERIAELKPALNIHAGGNGARKQKKITRKPKLFAWEREINLIGSRVYAARILLSRDTTGYIDKSNLDRIREIAYG